MTEPCRFVSDQYGGEVDSWLDARGMARAPGHLLSGNGLIVPGVAAGWLYRTDSSVCLLDHFITNPAAALGARGAALNAITEQLLRAAQGFGARLVVALTHDTSIYRRARLLGFRDTGPCIMLVRET